MSQYVPFEVVCGLCGTTRAKPEQVRTMLLHGKQVQVCSGVDWCARMYREGGRPPANAGGPAKETAAEREQRYRAEYETNVAAYAEKERSRQQEYADRPARLAALLEDDAPDEDDQADGDEEELPS